jgi:hypothetical protein
MLVTGGGGYTKANVARCWATETGALVQQKVGGKKEPERPGQELPPTIYRSYFQRFDQKISEPNSGFKRFENINKASEVQRIQQYILRNLDALKTAPAPCMPVRLGSGTLSARRARARGREGRAGGSLLLQNHVVADTHICSSAAFTLGLQHTASSGDGSKRCVQFECPNRGLEVLSSLHEGPAERVQVVPSDLDLEERCTNGSEPIRDDNFYRQMHRICSTHKYIRENRDDDEEERDNYAFRVPP